MHFLALTLRRAGVLVLVVTGLVAPAFGYSVLAHEALIDALWEVRLRALLLERYPGATVEELKQAHGYAYGGAILQDLGYYPHGSAKFSDLTHYVRTGDFILALLNEAHDLNEMSFALGALSHYVGDLDGHRFAVNVGEPMLYPRLRKKYGPVVTYEQSPAFHLKTEFSFDVLEVARGNFAPQAYHDFIGFFVSKDLIVRAFRATYGLEVSDVFGDFDRAVNSYRSSISRVIPLATRVAWAQKQSEIQHIQPGASHRRFVYILKRSSYEKEWGKRLEEPSPQEKILAFLLRLVPPIGPLADLKFKMPTAQVEDLFLQSFVRASKQYHAKLDLVATRQLVLTNENYDVGTVTRPGEYFLADDIEAYWLHKLAEKRFSTLTPSISGELTVYFADFNAAMRLQKDQKAWKQLRADYDALQVAAVARR